MGWMALLDKDGEEIGIVGDDPWDIMGEAIREIRELYQKEFCRDVSEDELESIFEFCNPFPLEKLEAYQESIKGLNLPDLAEEMRIESVNHGWKIRALSEEFSRRMEPKDSTLSKRIWRFLKWRQTR